MRKNHNIEAQEISRESCVAVVLGARHNLWRDPRVLRTVRALTSAGYRVIAYTPLASKKDERPLAGVTVRYITPPGGRSRFWRKFVLDYLFYNIPVALDMKKNRVRVCHSNDFDTLPGGVLLRLLTFGKSRIVYDSHEDYPVFVAESYGKPMGTIIGVTEDIFTRLFVDLVITVSQTINGRFEKKGLKSRLVLNCQELLPQSQEAKTGDGRFRVVFQGNIARGRGYEQLIEAADLLVNVDGLHALRILLLGGSIPESYREELEKVISKKGLQDNFEFTGFVDHGEMMSRLRNADVGLIIYQPTPNNMAGLPNKLFEDLVAGIPIVASNFPEIARVVTEEGCGLVVDPTRPEEIANALLYLYRNPEIRAKMAAQGLRAAREKYNSEGQVRNLLEAYREAFPFLVCPEDAGEGR